MIDTRWKTIVIGCSTNADARFPFSVCFLFCPNFRADRGQAPVAYTQGFSLTFAKAICQPDRSDVIAASQALTQNPEDMLLQYAQQFQDAGMDNSVGGVDTLRHLFTLLLGLAQRESSGIYCTGRDTSSPYTGPDSSETGSLQTSWDSNGASPLLLPLFQHWNVTQAGCLLSVYSNGVTCDSGDWENWGCPSTGCNFQAVTKLCPSFAIEYAMVLARVLGGPDGEWGPIRRFEAQLEPSCDSLLQAVQTNVTNVPGLCAQIVDRN
jgi:hypothetical protein